MPKQQDSSPKLFSVDQAAAALSVSSWTIRKHLSKGTIKATRLGRRCLISAQEVTRIASEGLPSLSAGEAR